MFRSLIFFALLAVPISAEACFSCCSTYDLADPGAWGFKKPLVYKYVLGRVSKIEPSRLKSHGDDVLVTIDVLKDYRYPPGENKVEALANGTKTCGPQVRLGQYGKFGVDVRSGVPKLVSANYSF